ncbi:hypothetical protein YPPY66_4625, partial [Yersinia pestis PY-66]
MHSQIQTLTFIIMQNYQ